MRNVEAIHREEYDIVDDTDKVIVAQAPGRLQLFGEQGESFGGLRLALAIDRQVIVAVSARKDNSLRFYAADLGERKRTTLINLKYKREDRWANYLKLAVQGFADRGYPVKGYNFTLSGSVPQQVGLASSTAIETATAVALRSILAPDLSDDELKNLLAAASLSFLGRQQEAMDHLALLSACPDKFMIIDERAGSVRPIDAPLSNYRIMLTDSRVPRFGVESELRQRRSDLKRGLELLSRKKPDASFRDFLVEDLMDSMGALPEQIRRRSLHVVQEIQRVRDAEDALRRQDFSAFSKLVSHSHESLRDLFEVSCPEIDWLVKRSMEIEGVLCSRLTGQGFGGCIYTIIAESASEEYRRRLEDYERIFGFKPMIHEIKSAGAAGLAANE